MEKKKEYSIENAIKKFKEILAKEGENISAGKYDRLPYYKPSRRALENKLHLTWNGLKSYVLGRNPDDFLGNAHRFIDTLQKKKVVDIPELCDLYGCSWSRIIEFVEMYRSRGLELIVANNKVILGERVVAKVDKPDVLSKGQRDIIFAVASDWHFGSRACQITALKEFCEICKKRGVKHILAPGDIVAGYNVYRGQLLDLYGYTADEQENSVVANLPEGFEWWAIGGNHDYSFMKSGGHNPLLAIANRREDFHYLGYDEADIPLLQGVEAKLWHPSGGTPYALSYRLQKGIEQLAFNELQSIVRGVKDSPTIRFVFAGHLHVQFQAMFGSIFGAQSGCFEGRTNYLKRKGLSPAIGGWIIEARLGESGLLRNFFAKFYMFDEIEDDYKNFSHSLPEEKQVEPIL